MISFLLPSQLPKEKPKETPRRSATIPSPYQRPRHYTPFKYFPQSQQKMDTYQKEMLRGGKERFKDPLTTGPVYIRKLKSDVGSKNQTFREIEDMRRQRMREWQGEEKKKSLGFKELITSTFRPGVAYAATEEPKYKIAPKYRLKYKEKPNSVSTKERFLLPSQLSGKARSAAIPTPKDYPWQTHIKEERKPSVFTRKLAKMPLPLGTEEEWLRRAEEVKRMGKETWGAAKKVAPYVAKAAAPVIPIPLPDRPPKLREVAPLLNIFEPYRTGIGGTLLPVAKKTVEMATKRPSEPLLRQIGRGVTGLEIPSGADVFTAGGLPRTAEFALKQPVKAIGQELMGAVIELSAYLAANNAGKWLKQGKYAAAENLVRQGTKKVYTKLGEPLGRTWEKLPKETQRMWMQKALDTRLPTGQTVGEVTFGRPFKAMGEVVRGKAGFARIPSPQELTKALKGVKYTPTQFKEISAAVAKGMTIPSALEKAGVVRGVPKELEPIKDILGKMSKLKRVPHFIGDKEGFPSDKEFDPLRKILGGKLPKDFPIWEYADEELYKISLGDKKLINEFVATSKKILGEKPDISGEIEKTAKDIYQKTKDYYKNQIGYSEREIERIATDSYKRAKAELTTVKPAAPELEGLAKEAGKYKTAEEFVEAKASKYVYHTTTPSSLDGIIERGLTPEVAEEYPHGHELEDRIKKMVYFADTEKATKEAGTFSFGADLRVRKMFLDRDKMVDRKMYKRVETRYWGSDISPAEIEIKTDEGWIPLLEYAENEGMLEGLKKENITWEPADVEGAKSQLTSIWQKAQPPEVKRVVPEVFKKRVGAQIEPVKLEEPLPPSKVKPLIRKVTGQTKVGDVYQISGRKLLADRLRAQRKAAQIGARYGKEEATRKLKEHWAEVKQAVIGRKEARIRIVKMTGDIKKIDIAKLSPQEAEPIKSLLQNLDLVKRQKPAMLRLERTRRYLETDHNAEMPDYMMEKLSRLDKRNLNDITMDELDAVHNSVMHYAHLNKVKNQIKVGREIRRAKDAVDNSIAEMRLPAKIKNDIVESQSSKLGRFKRSGQLIKDTFGIRHDHYDLIIESLAGANSTMDKVLYQGVKEGKVKELAHRQEVFKQFQKDIKLVEFQKKYKIKDIASWQNERVKIEKFNLTRGERMALYRHSLNDNNLRHILEGGFGLKHSTTPFTPIKITEKEVNSIINSLTSAEKEFASKPVENLFNNQHDALNKVFYEKNGYPLPKENSYYPIDVMKTTLPADLEADSILEELKNKWVRIGLKKGMLQHRIKSRLPIYLNNIAYDINKSVLGASAYIGLEVPLSNASRLLYDRGFRAQMMSRYSPQTWKEIEKGLRDIAGDYQSYSTVEELAMKIKNKLSTAILSISFAIPKQTLSHCLYSVYVKPKYLTQGYIDYVAHPFEVSARHKLYSPEYLERAEGGYSRDVADIFKAGAEKKLYKGKAKISERLMGGIKAFDKGAVIPGMQGAVLQVIDEFKIGKLSSEVKKALDMTEADIPESAIKRLKLAYKFADYCTERTQPMFSPEHRSSLSRGSALEQLATQFSSFTNQALNLTRRTWREGLRTGDPQAYAKLAKVLVLLLVVNTGGVMAIDEIRDRMYVRKRKKEPLYKRYGKAVLSSVASYFYFLRDIEKSVRSKVERGTFLGYDMELPVFRAGNKLADVFADGIGALDRSESLEKRKKRAGKFIDGAVELLLLSQGLPYQTPKKIIKGTFGEPKKPAISPLLKELRKSTKGGAGFLLPSQL